jgi:hypothetical protein
MDYELEGSALVAELTAQVAALTAQVNDLTGQVNTQREYAELSARKMLEYGQQISLVEDALQRASTEVDHEAFKEMYQDIAEAIGFEMTREVEVTITMSQTVTVKVPFGEEPSEQDFWATRGEVLDSNYTVENEQDIEIEDVTFNRY